MSYNTVIVDKHPQTYGDKDSIDDRLFEHLDNDIQQKVISWIKSNFYHHTSVYRDSNSYGLKHLLEKRTGIYLTNNQFKDSMLVAGFKPHNELEFNWYFKLDPSSPAFAIEENDMAGKLRTFREQESMSQAEFARSLNIPLSTYRKWEQGVNVPPHYVFNMINMIMDYRYSLWLHGVYDDVRRDKNHFNDYLWEYEHAFDDSDYINTYTYCPQYLDIRMYEDKDCECTVFRLYPYTSLSIRENKDMFTDALKCLFNKYALSWFVDVDEVIDVVLSGHQLYTSVISVGRKCLGQYIDSDKCAYMSLVHYFDNTIMKFPLRGHVYEDYDAVVWTETGMKQVRISV